MKAHKWSLLLLVTCILIATSVVWNLTDPVDAQSPVSTPVKWNIIPWMVGVEGPSIEDARAQATAHAIYEATHGPPVSDPNITPRPTVYEVDRAPDLPRSEKARVYVEYADGRRVNILVPTELIPDGRIFRNARLPGDDPYGPTPFGVELAQRMDLPADARVGPVKELIYVDDERYHYTFYPKSHPLYSGTPPVEETPGPYEPDEIIDVAATLTATAEEEYEMPPTVTPRPTTDFGRVAPTPTSYSTEYALELSRIARATSRAVHEEYEKNPPPQPGEGTTRIIDLRPGQQERPWQSHRQMTMEMEPNELYIYVELPSGEQVVYLIPFDPQKYPRNFATTEDLMKAWRLPGKVIETGKIYRFPVVPPPPPAYPSSDPSDPEQRSEDVPSDLLLPYIEKGGQE